MADTGFVFWLRRLPACVTAALVGFVIGTAGISAAVSTPASATLASASRAGESPVTSTTALTPAPSTTDPQAETTTTTADLAPEVETTTPAPAPTTTAPAPITATAATAAAATAPAPAPEPEPAPAPPTPAEVGAAALARISYPWQGLGYSVSFEGENAGLLGKTDCGSKQIFVYVRPTQSVEQVAFVTAFELGHAVDCGRLTDARRAEWAGIRGFAAGWTWFPGCVCAEDDFGSGDFSMVFASWLVPNGGYRWRSNLAPPPSADMLDQLMPYLR